MTELSSTEGINEQTRQLDRLPLLDMLRLINDEDAKVAPAVRSCLPDVERLVTAFELAFTSGARILFIGAGTSGRLGLMEAAECPPTFGVPSDAIQAIMAGGTAAQKSALEGIEDDELAAMADVRKAGVKAGDLVIGLSASGATPYVLAALATARSLHATTAAIVCNRTHLEHKVDIVVTAVVGPEAVAGSTRMKAGTAQKMILNMVTTAAMVRSGKVYGNLMVDLKPANKKLKGRAERIVSSATGTEQDIAAAALRRAGGVPKVAILSILGDIPAMQAKKLLDDVGGRIHEALAEIDSGDYHSRAGS